jgi:hypothetical protein
VNDIAVVNSTDSFANLTQILHGQSVAGSHWIEHDGSQHVSKQTLLKQKHETLIHIRVLRFL